MIFDHDDGLLDIFEIRTVGLGVLRQRFIHLPLDTDVVDNQPLLLAFKSTVHPRDRLNQVVSLDRLINVNGIEKRHIKAREPHVDDDGYFEV